jgi:hypothetical protein
LKLTQVHGRSGRAVLARVAQYKSKQLADDAATHQAAQIRRDPILAFKSMLHHSILRSGRDHGIGQRSDYTSARRSMQTRRAQRMLK